MINRAIMAPGLPLCRKRDRMHESMLVPHPKPQLGAGLVR